MVRAGGSPYTGGRDRLIHASVRHEAGSASHMEQERLILIPEDGIVSIDVIPEQTDTRLVISVRHLSQNKY